MGFENILKKTTTTVQSTSKNIADKYEIHVRKKAIKHVAKKLKVINLTPADMEEDDYEAMVCDASKDIKSSYSKRAAQIGLSLLGLDLLTGI